MRVGVTGASGYVGGAVVRRLAAEGHAIVALVRPETRFERGGHEVVRGDVRDRGALRALAERCDAVVHAAAYVHRAADRPADREACFAVNAGATRALVEALAATGRTPGLVFVSTVAVYGATFTNASEDTPPRPASAYGESKLAGEQEVLAAAERGGIRGVVLRPAVVYGPGSPGNTARLLALVRRGVVPRIAGGRNRKSMVHVDDLASLVARALAAVAPGAHGPGTGATFNVAGEPVTVTEVVEALARGCGARPRWVPVPGWIAASAAGASRAAYRLSRGALPDLTGTLAAFAGEATVDASALRRAWGVTFRPTAEALERLAQP